MIKTWTQSVRGCLCLTPLSHVHHIFQNFDCFFVIDNDREYFLWEMWPPDDKNNLERLMFLPDAWVFTGRCSVFVCEIKPSETKRDRVSVCHRQNGIFNERLGLLPCFKQHHIDLGAGRWRVARFCFSCTGGFYAIKCSVHRFCIFHVTVAKCQHTSWFIRMSSLMTFNIYIHVI